MKVRIRFKSGPPKKAPLVAFAHPHAAPSPAAPPAPASGLASLLTPIAVLALAFAIWRLAADLGLAHPFLIDSGPLSRWQVWFAFAILLQGAAFGLNRRVTPARRYTE